MVILAVIEGRVARIICEPSPERVSLAENPGVDWMVVADCWSICLGSSWARELVLRRVMVMRIVRSLGMMLAQRGCWWDIA